MYLNGVPLPQHRLVTPGGIAGAIVLETVRHKALDRPTKRLRFVAADPAVLVPDLLDVELLAISEDVFVFGGIEASTTDSARLQYLAQAWRVTVPES